MYYYTFPYFYTGYFDTFSDLSLAAAGEIKRLLHIISQAALDLCPRALIDSIVPARSGRVLSRVGVESWLHDPDANRPRGTVALPTSMKGVRMDNFSVRNERNFHNLAAKPKRMHLLDKPNGYASAMVKSSLSHQMRFTVQALEEEPCAAGDPHVLQIKLLGDDSREPSSWEFFADGTCVADGSGAFVMDAIDQGMIQACKTWGDHDAFADIAEAIVLSKAAFDIKERACQMLSYIAWTVGRFHAQHLIEGMVAAGVDPMLEDLLSAPA